MTPDELARVPYLGLVWAKDLNEELELNIWYKDDEDRDTPFCVVEGYDAGEKAARQIVGSVNAAILANKCNDVQSNAVRDAQLEDIKFWLNYAKGNA